MILYLLFLLFINNQLPIVRSSHIDSGPLTPYDRGVIQYLLLLLFMPINFMKQLYRFKLLLLVESLSFCKRHHYEFLVFERTQIILFNICTIIIFILWVLLEQAYFLQEVKLFHLQI